MTSVASGRCDRNTGWQVFWYNFFRSKYWEDLKFDFAWTFIIAIAMLSLLCFVSSENRTNCVNCSTQHLFRNPLGNIDINYLAQSPSYFPNYMQERASLLGRFRKVRPEVSFINYEKLNVVKNWQSHIEWTFSILVQWIHRSYNLWSYWLSIANTETLIKIIKSWETNSK